MAEEEKPPTPGPSGVSKKKEEKARKKDQRSWENVMKSMGDMPDADKIDLMEQSFERRLTSLQKDRDNIQSELNKNILAKAKLEGLCRELQKQNKAIKDENIIRIKEEEEKRREVATNFTERLNSLSSMMDENKDKSLRLREENMNMTLKLTELYNKFQEREGHLADVNRQLEAQKELFESKIKKMELEYKADRKAWEEENKALLSNLLKSTETNRLLDENIKSMQANLDIYKNQYSDFEQTMSRSNEVFKTFHGEINKLQKSNTLLEKERADYIAKWKSCHKTVVEISEKNQQLVKKLEVNEKKLATLEKLCRQLQIERTNLHKQLQDKMEPLVAPQQNEDKSNMSSVDSSIPVMQQSAQRDVTKKEIPKTLNGDVKSANKKPRSDDEDSSSHSPHSNEQNQPGPSHSQEVDPGLAQSRMIISEFVDPDDPELIDAQLTESHLMEFSDTDVETGGDGSVPQLEDYLDIQQSELEFRSDENMDSAVTEAQASSSSDISIRETRSVPITKGDHDLISEEGSLEEPQSSGDLHGELSVGDLPLYKSAAVTDVPTQGGHITLVKESEARTNILEPSTPNEEELSEQTVPTQADSSTETIELKESEGKTEIKKE